MAMAMAIAMAMAMAMEMAMEMEMEAKRVSLLSLPFYAPYSNQGFSDRIKIRKKGGGRPMVPELTGLLERILLSVHMGNFWSTEIQTLIITLFRKIMLAVPKGARATCAETF